MAKEVEITKENYDTEVTQSEKPVLLDFWATWCGPCQMVAPVLSELAAEHEEIKVGKVNVDEQPYLAQLFGIEAIPTLVVMKDGQAVKAAFGFQTKQQLEELIKAAF
ncbi:MAG TPA: thioredoxin [Clostridiales bacterium]|nr:thioredoxin [Clostridiales bacterium]